MWIFRPKVMAIAVAATTLLVGCGSADARVDKELAYRKAGMNSSMEGNYEEAVKSYDNALNQSQGKIGPLEIDLCFYKAEAQIRGGNEKEALNTYNAILKYDDKNYDTYYLRGCFYLRTGEYKKAIQDYHAAVELQKENYSLFIAIYQSLSGSHMESEAAGFLKQALKIDGKEAEDYRERGRVYLLLKDYDKAGTNLDKAQNMGDDQAKLYMAQLLDETGDSKAAGVIYKNYAKTHKKDGNAQEKLGDILFAQEDYQSAMEAYKQALATNNASNKQKITKHMIACYEYLGDFSTATAELEGYIEEYPMDETVLREYDFLKTR
ncbi:MAG: tetratricopeptide repeat protein [Lachnospiraceae bacterium]